MIGINNFSCFYNYNKTQSIINSVDATRGFNRGIFRQYTNYKIYGLPSPQQICEKLDDRHREAYKHLNKELVAQIQAGDYTKKTRMMRSWQSRSASPDMIVESLLRHATKGGENKHSLFSDLLKDCEKLEDFHGVLQKHGGLGLENLTIADFKFVWDKFKQARAYNDMVELIHCSSRTAFTSSSEILIDYSFVLLNSSYVQPRLSGEIASRILQKENLSEAHYISGLSHITCAWVARAIFDLPTCGNKSSTLLRLYKECFPLICSREETFQRYQNELILAEARFRQAFAIQSKGQYALVALANLIEQGKIIEAKNLASEISQKLAEKSDPTLQDLQALLMADIVLNETLVKLSSTIQKIMVKEPKFKGSLIDNLQIFKPFSSEFWQIEHVIEILQKH